MFSAGCATYQAKVDEARSNLQNQNYNAALKILEPLSKESGKDQLVYLFDYATALQSAGDYKASNDQFISADRLADMTDYFSISKFGSSLLLNEEMTQYKGDDYEKLLISVMSALNFLMLSDYENAQVQIRRLNEKLEYFRLEQKKEFDQNTAAMYLAAMIWEAARDWDSAYIYYEKVYNKDPSLAYIKEDLLRLSIKAGREDAAKKWGREFGLKVKPEWKDKNFGELILVYQQGWGPRKAERPRVATMYGFVSPGFPMLVPTPSFTQRAHLEISQNISLDSQFIYSVQDASIKALEDGYAPLIAKRIAAYIAKEMASQSIGKKNEAVGAIFNIAMHIADRADLRQWSTLPETFQVARIYLPVGKYSVQITGQSQSGVNTGENRPPENVEIKPQQKTFISWRSFR